MSVSIIDGVIDQVQAGRQTHKICRFKSITFQEAGGQHRTLKSLVTKPAIADRLTVGRRARFYIYSGLDHKGVYGIRTEDGQSLYAYPAGGNRVLGFFNIGIGLLWILLRVFIEGDIPLLGVAIVILGIVLVVATTKSERESRAQFEADSRT